MVSNTIVRKGMWVRIPPAAPSDPSELRPPCRAVPPDRISCIDERGLGAQSVYLLGLYLGDGVISRGARDVWRLRISQDRRYPRLIDDCKTAITEVTGKKPGVAMRIGCVDIYCYWKHWPCVFPQLGPGPKHLRRIELEAGQWRLVECNPRELVKGLIHSDGCRVTNRVRSPAGRRYEYPRYFFTNHSADTRSIFDKACGMLGVECRPDHRYDLSIAQRRSVAILDEFIGPKG